ncbi:MAG: tetratricopeptide repeat protein [Candidatus Omnitrophica bacterium]|nr:tetratricopeptide repeat protein [Candidatus Omnitrophota bacterium]MCM8830785.1 tetratricopeptide repeat protein [Candidatus Omnitrophota bacterium]
MKYFLIFLLLFIPISATPKEESLKEQKKQEARAYRAQGYKLQSMGNIKEAMSFYKKAIELDPSYVEAINDLGVVYETLGDLESALAMYKKVLQIDSNYLPVYTNLGFLYEKKGDILNATNYWAKRYELGEEGEYWREVAAQHLLKLGTYPEIKKALQEKEAIKLSKELAYIREQERLKILEEAKLHFDISSKLYLKGDYTQALKEIDTALSLDPPDEELKIKMLDLRKKIYIIKTKEEARVLTEGALADIKKEDFLLAAEKLKNALSALFSLSKEK